MRRAAFTVLLAACASQPTSDIHEAAQVLDLGDHIDIAVYFERNGESIKLDDDLLDVTFRGEDHLLPYSNVTYGGSIPLGAPLAADEPVVLALRNDGEMLVSTITAPPPFTLSPVPASVSRANDLPVTFSPGSADETSWTIVSGCVWGGGAVATGADNVLIQASELSTSAGGTCTASLEITRTRYASPPAPVHDGELQFVTRAATTFSSTP